MRLDTSALNRKHRGTDWRGVTLAESSLSLARLTRARERPCRIRQRVTPIYTNTETRKPEFKCGGRGGAVAWGAASVQSTVIETDCEQMQRGYRGLAAEAAVSWSCISLSWRLVCFSRVFIVNPLASSIN